MGKDSKDFNEATRPPDDFSENPPGGIVYDWHAYYREFKQLHGKHPVQFNGRQLFPDGWQYSAVDPQGPEYRPPERPEELRKLQTTYWRIRRHLVRHELGVLRDLFNAVRNYQSTRSATLKRIMATRDDETGKQAFKTVDVDITQMEKGRMQWLTDDLVNCEEKLQALAEGSANA